MVRTILASSFIPVVSKRPNLVLPLVFNRVAVSGWILTRRRTTRGKRLLPLVVVLGSGQSPHFVCGSRLQWLQPAPFALLVDLSQCIGDFCDEPDQLGR